MSRKGSALSSHPNVAATQKPPSSSSNRTNPPTEEAPIFGSVTGYHGASQRGTRDKTGSLKDDPNDPQQGRGRRQPDASNGTSSSNGTASFFRRHSPNKQGSRPQSPQIPSAQTSDDEDAPPERRGSVIGKLGQRAKQVLPLGRTSKESGREGNKADSSRTLSSKPTLSQLSSQSTGISGRGETSLDSSTDEEDDEDDDEDDTVVASNSAGTMGNTSRDHSSTDDVNASRKVTAISSPPLQTPASLAGPGRPNQQSRSISSDMLMQAGQSAQNQHAPPGAVKRSNKIMEMAPSDLPNARSPGANSPNTSTSKLTMKNSATVASFGLDKKKSSGAQMAEMSRSSSGSSEVSNVTSQGAPSNANASPSNSRPGTAAATSRPVTSERARAIPATVPRVLQSKSTASRLMAQVRKKHPPSLEPPIPDPGRSPKVDIAPPSGMYWSKAPCYEEHTALRAHTATLVGGNIYVFGGCDAKACFNDLYVFDADSMFWSRPDSFGEKPPPLRAMTATAVGKKIIVFGGGDGPTYYHDIYVLDTISFWWTKVDMKGIQPSKRRAHTACLYKNGIYVFGGGDGVRALNDVWRLDVADVSKMSWKLISKPSKSGPTSRGYHTANMVGSKLIIFGGSDGVECFRDVWVFDVETCIWKNVDIKTSYPRLSHTATIVGSYMFVIGGHDGVEYSSEVLLLNLVTMMWDRRRVYGKAPSGRGYHGAVLYDSRVFVMGGFDG
jgi:N-acetylneuraminic acid mutarotase